MEKIKVLLVEGEPILAVIIKGTLDGNEFDITLAADGGEGLFRYTEIKPDIIVAGIMMPKIDGFTMIKLVRETDTRTPVLFLSARSVASDVVEDFELGDSDYLKKPFGMVKLIVRIRALLHRVSVQRPGATSFRIGFYTSNSITQTLVYRGEEQLFNNRGSEILKRLCDNESQVLPMGGILIGLWGGDSFFNARSLHVFITKLRYKLSKGESIKTLNIRRIGYKLIIG